MTDMPWLFGIALFVMSILLFSQAATIRALLPLGMALGISPYMLIALFPAVNGYFFIPNYPTVVAAINFDTTGTTRIGKYVLNHSFMMPGLISNHCGGRAGHSGCTLCVIEIRKPLFIEERAGLPVFMFP